MKPRKDLSTWTLSMAQLPLGHFWQLRACSLVSLLLKQLLPVVQPSWGGAECIASCYHSRARRQQSKSSGPDREQWVVKVSSSSSQRRSESGLLLLFSQASNNALNWIEVVSWEDPRAQFSFFLFSHFFGRMRLKKHSEKTDDARPKREQDQRKRGGRTKSKWKFCKIVN